MELKYYDKPWLPAFKGAFLILFGIIAMFRIFGSIQSLSVLFVALIGMISILLLSTGILFKKSRFRIWTIVSGIINLGFCIYIALHIDSPRDEILWIIFLWLLFYAVGEIIEAGILIALKNAFAALFVLNALLTLLFGFLLLKVSGNFTSQGVFLIGLIALVFGIVNVLSSYLLSRIREKN
jgi:hypothetical protein